MAKTTVKRRVTGKPKKNVRSPETTEIERLHRRIEALEDAVDRLQTKLFYDEAERARFKPARAAITAGTDRFARATTDGWLLVMMSGEAVSLPSGIKVSLTNSAGGRDYGEVKEGIHRGKTFDVKSGNLEASFRRLEQLKAVVTLRTGGPITIDGVDYDLQVTITYNEGGTSKVSGPHTAKTAAGNTLPVGDHDIEIADFPHKFGASYGAYGTAWFRIGHQGDRYVHPGRISNGCLTCLPSTWDEIYKIFHCARKGDNLSIGTLTVEQMVS